MLVKKKIQITVPATTANLGPGFDFLGLALSLYNSFLFEESEKDETVGFGDMADNKVLYCFKEIIHKYRKKDICVKITQLQNDVPLARGLGSSATAIVAGTVAANIFLENKLSEKELIQEMVRFEGHPDNILPCFYGGMVSSIQTNDDLFTFKHQVSDNLHFTVLIPSYYVKTEDARKVLPSSYSLSDITFNASRAMLITKAFEDGDIDMIKYVLMDKIHEPYRKQFIKEWVKIEQLIQDKQIKLNISGSGPTMLLISKEKIDDELLKQMGSDLITKSLTVDRLGCRVEVMGE